MFLPVNLFMKLMKFLAARIKMILRKPLKGLVFFHI
ncbi:hypothetical protein a48_210 [Escherichia phage a48]|nr:hypothetical protein a48_210 [Escherichia phage a48]